MKLVALVAVVVRCLDSMEPDDRRHRMLLQRNLTMEIPTSRSAMWIPTAGGAVMVHRKGTGEEPLVNHYYRNLEPYRKLDHRAKRVPRRQDTTTPSRTKTPFIPLRPSTPQPAWIPLVPEDWRNPVHMAGVRASTRAMKQRGIAGLAARARRKRICRRCSTFPDRARRHPIDHFLQYLHRSRTIEYLNSCPPGPIARTHNIRNLTFHPPIHPLPMRTTGVTCSTSTRLPFPDQPR